MANMSFLVFLIKKGKVKNGLDVVKKIESFGSSNG